MIMMMSRHLQTIRLKTEKKSAIKGYSHEIYNIFLKYLVQALQKDFYQKYCPSDVKRFSK